MAKQTDLEVLAAAGIPEPTRKQKRALKAVGIDVWAFLRPGKKDATTEEAEAEAAALEKMKEDIIEALGLTAKLDEMGTTKADRAIVALLRCLLGNAITENAEMGNSNSSSGTAQTPGEPSTVTPVGAQESA